MLAVGVLILAVWLYLALLHGQFWRPLFAAPVDPLKAWPDVDIIVPARDEAEALPASLPSLLAQDYPGAWRIILVDDHSTDGTADCARKIAATQGKADRLLVINAPDLPEGWSGKVAAMQAGAVQSKTAYILFTDADIRHPTSSLRELTARAERKKLDLASLMVKLHCQSAAEKLLIPAFVFFFAMLYPFRHASDLDSKVAAAAGGVMLVRRQALDNIGGFARIKSALIDDCALARAIKDNGGERGTQGSIELTTTREVESLRAYPRFADIERMVARCAYTQLHHSPLLLCGAMIGMGLLFLVPIWFFLATPASVAACALGALLIMTTIYVPMIVFYGLPFFWAFTLPLAALFYIGATIDSARLYWQGKGGTWKGRAQA